MPRICRPLSKLFACLPSGQLACLPQKLLACLLLTILLAAVWPLAEAKAALPFQNDANIEITIQAYDLAALPNLAALTTADAGQMPAPPLADAQQIQGLPAASEQNRPDLGAAEEQQMQALRAVLCISLNPGAGRYLYAPFSDETPRPDAASLALIAEISRPMRLELTPARQVEDAVEDKGATEDAVHTELNSPARPEQTSFQTKILYPPGSLRYDEFSGIRLPVYNAPPTILVYLPEAALNRPLTLKLDALICSATSCLPYKTEYNFKLSAQDLLTDGLPALLTDGTDRSHYHEMPEAAAESGINTDTAPDVAAPGTYTVSPNSLNDAGYDNPDNKNSSARSYNDAGSGRVDNERSSLGYQERFRPRYTQSALEVSGLGRAVLLGLLAGFILNFMPCVLPVITLKIGTLAGLGGWQGLAADSVAARRGRQRFRTYSLFFALGVLVWFGALFGIIGLAGQLWGQLFQSQILILALALLLFLLALSLFGVFHLPVLSVQTAALNKNNSSLAGQAFTAGLLATLLATPCSGPLLGGVLGWAVGQPLHFLALTLLSVGLGMASPFLLLSLKPDLARWLPKPGVWSQILEKILAILLLATVIYLLSLAGIANNWTNQPESRTDSQANQSGQWQNFTPDGFEAVLGKENLLLEFTADWCINCRAMEATTLSEARRIKWAREYGLRFIKVDITRNNPAGEELLAALGSNSIPLLAVFPAESTKNNYRDNIIRRNEAGGANKPIVHEHMQPLVLRDLITPGQLESALQEALFSSIRQSLPIK